MDVIIPLLLQVVLISLNALFACAEIAVLSINEAKLNKLISEGNKKAKTLYKLTSNPSKFLSMIQIAITLAGFLGSAFAADNFAVMITNWLTSIGVANSTNVAIYDTISVVVVTLILSYFTLVFGELIPKRIGMRKAESIALSLAGMLNFFSKVFTPIVWLLTASINGVLKLIGIDPNQSDGDEGEENIRMMVDMSSEKGLIDKEEQEMIRNVFEFDDLAVIEFATHRTDVEFLWMDDTVEQWDKIIKNSFHKYYPICKDSVDDIVGILNIQSYFRADKKDKDAILKKCVTPAYFVPETLKADVLFKQMKETRQKIAVVLDEHGGVEGIVTMDDILEQIVGDFNHEDKEPSSIKQINETTWEVEGNVLIDDINQVFGTNFSIDDYDTFSGLIFGHHGTIPPDDTKFETEISNLQISVIKILDHKIEKAIIKKKCEAV